MLTRKVAGAHGALLQRRLHFVPFQHTAPCYRRLYSIPTPNATPGVDKQNTDLPPLPPAKKPKLDLRPAPIKPKQSVGTTPKPQTKQSLSSGTEKHALPTLPTLGAAKEETKHDIQDAQAHGILAPPPPDATWFKRTLHQVIEITKFYYRGTKLIFTRRKTISSIHARIQAGGAPLTRAEFRLIETQKDDITKLVPFLIIALLLEEVIPLIAIYAPFMLPSTCILPSQRERIETKRTEKALAFAEIYAGVYTKLSTAEGLAPSGHMPLAALRTVADAPTAVCGSLGLSTIGFDALRIRRIRRRLEFITRDDQMLLKDNAALSRREIIEALEERGIRTAPTMTYKQLQAQLLKWLDAVKDVSTGTTPEALERRLALVVSNAASAARS